MAANKYKTSFDHYVRALKIETQATRLELEHTYDKSM